MLLTPNSLWGNFTATAGGGEILREYREDGVLFREVRFSGRTTEDGTVSIYAVAAIPDDGAAHPGILFCRNAQEHCFREELVYFVSRGYTALCFDYAGEVDDVGDNYTVYPESISYANYEKAGRRLTHCDESADKTTRYEWVAVAWHAAKYLSEMRECSGKVAVFGVREGGYLVWPLAGFCPYVDAAVSCFYVGWTEYCNEPKYSDDNESESLSEERQRWFAAVAAQAYAQHVKIPFLFLGATNDRLGIMDRVADSMSRIRNAESRFVFVPRYTDLLNDSCAHTLDAFLRQYLSEGEALPHSPQGQLYAEDGKLFFSVKTEGEAVARAELYYALGEVRAEVRNWCAPEETDCVEGVFRAEIPRYDSSAYVFGYACVQFQNGVYLSTNLVVANPAKLQIPERTLQREQMIYNAAMGVDSFTALSKNNEKADHEIFAPDTSVALTEGALGIRGIAPLVGLLATFKLNDIQYRAEEDSVLKFDVSCRDQTAFMIYALTGSCDELTIYAANVRLLGGELWQTVELPAVAMKTKDNLPMKSWRNCELACFACDKPYALNNMLWL